MSDVEIQEGEPVEPVEEQAPEPPREPAPPIESRFLFVDVAALRAKQLRRGAKVRLAEDQYHIARVISDVWLSNLLAWLTRRASATDVSKRLDLAVRLLIGDGEHPKI